MGNPRLGRNILLAGALVSLAGTMISMKNKDLTGLILFGIQGVLFLLGAFLQHREMKRQDRKKPKQTIG